MESSRQSERRLYVEISDVAILMLLKMIYHWPKLDREAIVPRQIV